MNSQVKNKDPPCRLSGLNINMVAQYALVPPNIPDVCPGAAPPKNDNILQLCCCVRVVKTVLLANGHFAGVTPAIFGIFVDFRGSRSKIPCFLWVECNIRIFVKFSSKPPVSAGDKTTVFQNDRFDNPDCVVCLGLGEKNTWNPPRKSSLLGLAWRPSMLSCVGPKGSDICRVCRYL